jgi:hypothetical protein
MILDSVRNNLLASELSAIARNYIEFAEQFDAFSLPMSAMLRVPIIRLYSNLYLQSNPGEIGRFIGWEQYGNNLGRKPSQMIPNDPKTALH